ncbi:STAS domain-containing protein [uncultured Jatrophihabitans sp.]|uniref:STAS domain-containing protein n=1 Tax=uncultured Jatrophihabitans sp. TaxID=1610747 RepID=UPI0035CBE106
MGAGAVVVAWQGRVDAANIASQRAQIDDSLEGDPDSLLIDMSGVSFVDSSGLGTLVYALNECQQRGTALSLTKVPGDILRLLQRTMLDRVFTIV